MNTLDAANKTIDNKYVAKIFKHFTMERARIHIKIPQGLNNVFKEARSLTYKNYCLPMPAKGNHFVLSSFGTNKFLKIVKPFISSQKMSSKKIDSTIKRTDDSMIKIYAAGAIEKAENFGIGPREELKSVMRFTRARIVNPCDFDYNKIEYPNMLSYQANHSPEETYKYAQPIVDGDIDAVINSDIVLVYLDEKCGIGTASEITLARAIGKPVYAVIAKNTDLNKISPWILACPYRFFNSFNEFRKFFIK